MSKLNYTKTDSVKVAKCFNCNKLHKRQSFLDQVHFHPETDPRNTAVGSLFVREINKLNLEFTIGDFASLPSYVLELTVLVKIAIINKNAVSRALKQLIGFCRL